MRQIDDLGDRGRALWDDLADDRMNTADKITLVEMCRMADRLDVLDRVLTGDAETWARITERHNGRSHTYELILDDALAEARQLAATFTRLAQSLKIPEAKAAATDGIDDLARRRDERRSG